MAADFTKTALGEFCTNLIALDKQEETIFRLALDTKVIKELIIYRNTNDQLFKDSVDSLGQRLFNSYTNRDYYSQNDPKGRGGKPYQVYDTGEFYNSFRVFVRQGSIEITADPLKEDVDLFEAYGVDIVGLTNENLDVLINESLEHFIRWYEKNILPQ